MSAVVEDIMRSIRCKNSIPLSCAYILKVLINLAHNRLLTGYLMEEFCKLGRVIRILHFSDEPIDIKLPHKD
jgi:hypothetical protein